MLAFLPIIGPIIQGISNIFTGFFNKEIAVVQAGAQVTVAETQASAQIIHDTQDDLGLRLMRDLYCFPAVVQVALTGWDTMIAENSWNVYMWHVAKFPPSLEWYPYSVAVFLLGNIGLNMWNRK